MALCHMNPSFKAQIYEKLHIASVGAASNKQQEVFWAMW